MGLIGRSPRGRNLLWRRNLLFGCVAVALLLSACGPKPAPTPSPEPSAVTATPGTPASSALFYAKSGRIYVSETGDNPGRAITNGTHDDEPAPAPEGRRFAFIRMAAAADPTTSRGGELWVARRDGSGAHRLLDPAAISESVEGRVASEPRWSPAGDKIAVIVPGEADGGYLTLVDSETGAVTQTSPPVFASSIAWSPDGMSIAWNSARSDVGPREIGTVNGSSGRSKVLVDGTNASSVDWSSDSAQILFTNQYVAPEFGDTIPFTLKTAGIYSLPTTATKPRAVTIDTGTDFLDDIGAFDGGRQIGFTSQAVTAGSTPPPKLLKSIDSTGSAALTIFDRVAPESPGPRWSAAGQAALVVDGTEKVLTVVTPTTGIEMPVDNQVTSFAWVPPAAPISSASRSV